MSDRLLLRVCALLRVCLSRRVCSDADPGFLLNTARQMYVCVADRSLPNIHIPYCRSVEFVDNLFLSFTGFARFIFVHVRSHFFYFGAVVRR